MKRLDDAFNISETEVVETEKVGITPEQKPDRIVKDDITRDYEYTRGNLYSIIEKGQEAIDGILELAQESDMPRAYEVAGQLIKTVSEVTERLADLQQKMQFLKEVPDKAPQNVTNALFIGSTKELQQLMKQNKNEAIESKKSET